MRAAVIADEALQRDLMAATDEGDLAELCSAIAGRLGLSLSQADIAGAFDPAHLPPFELAALPPRQWLPVQVFSDGRQLLVEWLHFGFAALAEPFYEQSVARARALPINRLLRLATPFEAVRAIAGESQPDGLLFHMSRCGSTLVARILAADAGHVVVSEPPPLDIAFRLHFDGAIDADLVRGMAAALTRDRNGHARRRFIKLDSWHALALPRIAALLGDCRWAFLYREPVEVLVSHARRAGMQTIPGAVPLASFGLAGADRVAPEDFARWVIDAIVRSALAAAQAGHGLLIDYRQLPGAVGETILPYFGTSAGPAAMAAMTRAARHDSKNPDRTFIADGAGKQAEASALIREQAAAIGVSYRRLEAIRARRARSA
ncbi:MAG: aspartyl beta-hydroxylase [Sphingomonadales bacterium]|nr:aspartyl beta-hydroxylase [Sphingomonadales bacterium]